jgi:hypothetical protein
MKTLLAILVVCCAAGHLAPATGQTITPRFGWLPGMEAEVEHHRTRSHSANPQRDIDAVFRFALRVDADPDGLLVTLEPENIAGFSAADLQDELAVQDMLAQLTTATSFVVSSSGEFLRMQDHPNVADFVEWLAAGDATGEAPLPASAAGMLRQLGSREFLESRLADDWAILVGLWADDEWEMGLWYESESEVANPLQPDILIPLLVEFSALGSVACVEDGPVEDDCVEFHFISTYDAGALGEFMKWFMTDIGADMSDIPESMFSELRMVTEYMVVAEPETLRPHFVVEYKEVTLPDETGEIVSQVTTNARTFFYSR